MATPAAAPAAPAPSTSAFSPTSAAALNRSAGGVVGPPVAPPSLTVALDEGELNPEALVNLLEDPSLTEKKSKKYALKIKDLNKKYAELCVRGEAVARVLRSQVDTIAELQREIRFLRERKHCWDLVYGQGGHAHEGGGGTERRRNGGERGGGGDGGGGGSGSRHRSRGDGGEASSSRKKPKRDRAGGGGGGASGDGKRVKRRG